MPKKKTKRVLTPEQKQAASERMKAKWAERKAKEQQASLPHIGAGDAIEVPADVKVLPKNVDPQPPMTTPLGVSAPAVPDMSPDVIALLQSMQQQIDELRAANVGNKIDPAQAVNQLAQYQGAQLGPNGVMGQVFKYPVEKSHYPDPTPRLYDDPKLRRFAMRENFYFKWDVVGETYEKGNIMYSEPRFIVELFRYMFDEEGNPTGKMILVNRQMQHEDELIARMAADRMGWKVGEHFADFNDLMNEMRYYRIRQWLLGVFTPPHINQHAKKQSTMVIGGKVVEVFDTEQLTDKETAVAQTDSIKRETAL